MTDKEYDEQQYLLHIELRKWSNNVRETGSSHIVIFEGRDAAGKSSAVKRITEHLSPRSSRIVALDKPTEQERSQWYWSRYIAQFPRAGEICFFDRSWYNRAGVECVMGFATPNQINDFYRECPQLEKMWIKSGINITKFYFSISRDEQARRFNLRTTDPLKTGKLSEMDRVSQTKWDAYTSAKKRMLALTNLRDSPWVIVDSNDKRSARLNCQRYLLHKNDYEGRDLQVIGTIDPNVLKVKE
jgi:hypothetical protein